MSCRLCFQCNWSDSHSFFLPTFRYYKIKSGLGAHLERERKK